ncbi:MAG: SGNH/GDSL hydrolase family protein [Thermodesulfobacteriota bacterium]
MDYQKNSRGCETKSFGSLSKRNRTAHESSWPHNLRLKHRDPKDFSKRLLLVMRMILFWLLFPFVLPQALKVRRSAPRLLGANGPHKGRFGSGNTLNLLAIGDSIIAGVGARTVEQALPGQVALELAKLLGCEVRWQALGSIGATSATVRSSLFPSLPRDTFDVMVLSVGVNDVTSLRRTSSWSKDLGNLLDQLRRHSPEAAIVMVGLPPLSKFPLLPQPLRAVMGIRATVFDNVAVQVISMRAGIVHVPLPFDLGLENFSSDGFHPSPSSHRNLGQNIAGNIAAVIAREQAPRTPSRKDSVS